MLQIQFTRLYNATNHRWQSLENMVMDPAKREHKLGSSGWEMEQSMAAQGCMSEGAPVVACTGTMLLHRVAYTRVRHPPTCGITAGNMIRKPNLLVQELFGRF